MASVPASFVRFATDLDAELQSSLPDPSHLPGLYGMLRYHLGWVDDQFHPAPATSGKRLRPVLCLLSCQAMEADPRLALPAAAAVEMIHNFSLVHDDIEDRSSERRHRPTLWKLWGEAQAINAGDVLFAIAFNCLHRLRSLGHPPITVLAASEALSRACTSLCEGQYLDISFEHRLDVSEEDYYLMIGGKTAALISCATKLGALIGGGTTARAEPLASFGFHLGLAFQVQDDVLGIWGEERQTGKPRGDDIRQRKKTLPLLYASRKASGKDRERLVAILRSPGAIDDELVTEAVAVLDRCRARQYAEDRAAEHHKRALLELQKVKPYGRAIEELREVADYLLDRRF